MKSPDSDSLILKLHAANDSEKLWQAAKLLLQQSLDFHHMLLGLPSVAGFPAFMRTTMPMPAEPAYFERLGQLAPSSRFIAENPGTEIGRMSDMMSEKDLLSSEFYQEIMRPEGWRYAAGIFFWAEGRFIGHLALNRTSEQGDFSPADLEVLKKLHPQLRVAVLRVRAAETDRALLWNLKSMMAAQPQPFALLDLQNEILFQSSAFGEACREWSGITGEDRLPIDLQEELEKLRRHWEQSVLGRNPLKIDRSTARSVHRRLEHPSIPGFSVDLQLLENAHSGFAGGQVKVEFTRPIIQDGVTLSAGEIQTRLTPAQQRVGRLIVRGLSYSQAAEELGLSENTVRNHLAHIYKALGINSRSQLAAILLPQASKSSDP